MPRRPPRRRREASRRGAEVAPVGRVRSCFAQLARAYYGSPTTHNDGQAERSQAPWLFRPRRMSRAQLRHETVVSQRGTASDEGKTRTRREIGSMLTTRSRIQEREGPLPSNNIAFFCSQLHSRMRGLPACWCLPTCSQLRPSHGRSGHNAS